MSAQLKQLSATYHVPVLVINQVTDFFAGADANGGEGLRIDQVKHSLVTIGKPQLTQHVQLRVRTHFAILSLCSPQLFVSLECDERKSSRDSGSRFNVG